MRALPTSSLRTSVYNNAGHRSSPQAESSSSRQQLIRRKGSCRCDPTSAARGYSRARRLQAQSGDENDEEWEWREDEVSELSKMMPDPENDIYDRGDPGRELQELGLSGHSSFDTLMDQTLKEMAGVEEDASALVTDELVEERGYNPDDFIATEQEVKEARDAANFHAKAAWRDGIVGRSINDAIQLNNLNMQRAVNRYKVTKEMGRWVEYFEKVENDKGYYVRKVPAWVKAVHLINWDFENLNETHRLEDLDDDEEEEDDDDEDEEADDEEGDGLMAGTLMWELPQLEISGVETPQVGYPTAAIAEANAIAEEHLADRENTMALGYVKEGTFDFEKIEQMPPASEIYADAVEEKVEKDDEEELLSEEEKEMLIATADAPERRYLSPDESAPVDETTALLWDVILPSGGPRETAIMGDILGTGANEDADTAKDADERFDDDLDLDLDDDFDIGDLEDLDDI